MWLRFAPSTRLALLLAVAAVLAGVGALWGLTDRLATASLAVVAVLGAVDILLLRRRPVAAAHLPVELVGSLRRPLVLSVGVGASSTVADWVPNVPRELGGPVQPSRLVPAPVARRTSWQVTPRQRGTHDISELWVREHSPVGLWVRRRRLATACRVTVLPDLRGPAEDSIGLELEGERQGRALFGAQLGSELRSLRPFQSGDDPRHVAWKATARYGAPVVREWEPDRRRAVLVALDAGRLMRAQHDGESKFDAALRAVARLGVAAEARRDQIGVVVFADRLVRRVPPLCGAGQAARLLRFVGDLSATGVESDLTWALPWLLAEGKRSLVVIVTDIVDAAGAQRLVAAAAAIRERHVPVVSLLRDPHLDEAFATEVQDVGAGFRRVAAEMVARHRSDALSLLRARGVVALDLSMRSVALELVDTYLRAARGGLL